MTREEMKEWVRAAAQIQARRPQPKTNMAAVALKLHNHDGLRLDGNATFRKSPAVVRGKRGGLYEAEVRFSEVFSFGGEDWIAVSHTMIGLQDRRIMVDAMRREAVEQMFRDGLFFNAAERERLRVIEARRASTLLMLTYGLSTLAYEAAVKTLKAGAAKGHDVDGTPTGIGKRLPAAAKLMRAADTWSWCDMLEPANRCSREIFGTLTACTLPHTLRDSRAMIAGPAPDGLQTGAIAGIPACLEAIGAVWARAMAPDRLGRALQENETGRYLFNPYVRNAIEEQAGLARDAASSYLSHTREPWLADGSRMFDAIAVAVARLDVGIPTAEQLAWTGRILRTNVTLLQSGENARLNGQAADRRSAA